MDIFAFLILMVLCVVAYYIRVVYRDFTSTSHLSIPDNKAFDYIIVGGGTAGCLLARRIAEAPTDGEAPTVLLLEAGKDEDKDNLLSTTRVPWFAPQLPRVLARCLRTPDQPGLGNRVITYFAGKVLGGSGLIDWMLYRRGGGGDFEEWNSLPECRGDWGYEQVLPYYVRSELSGMGESNRYHDPALGDKKGPGVPPLQGVSWNLPPSPLAWHFVNAAAAALGVPKITDYNQNKQEGASVSQCTVSIGGSRSSTSRAFLGTTGRALKNLTIRTVMDVSKVLFEDGTKARAVLAYDFNNKRYTFVARKEVILCSGVVGSPSILLRSGVGPKAELEALGIDTVVDCPSVGKNFVDPVSVPLVLEARRGLTFDFANVLNLRNIFSYFVSGTGPMRSNLVEALAFFKTEASMRRPNAMAKLWLAGGHNMTIAHGLGMPKELMKFTEAVAIFTDLLHPASRGEVKLSSKSSTDAPIVDPNYLGEKTDLDQLTAALKKTATIPKQRDMGLLLTGRLASYLFDEPLSDANIKEYVKSLATSSHNAVGTCSMATLNGLPPVVSSKTFEVLGCSGLRVVDCSVAPVPAGGGGSLATMLAERGADAILGRAPQPSAAAGKAKGGSKKMN